MSRGNKEFKAIADRIMNGGQIHESKMDGALLIRVSLQNGAPISIIRFVAGETYKK